MIEIWSREEILKSYHMNVIIGGQNICASLHNNNDNK